MYAAHVAPKLTGVEAEASNLACRLAAVAARELGTSISFGGKADAEETMELGIAINGALASIYVPARLMRDRARGFFQLGGDYQVPEALVGPVFEAGAAQWIGRLEKAAGVKLEIRKVAAASAEAAAKAPLAFTVAGHGVIAVTPPNVLSVAKVPAVAWTDGGPLRLRVPLVVAEIGVTVAELDELDRGDVVLLPGVTPETIDTVHLAILPGRAIMARIDGPTLTVARVGKQMSTSDAAAGAKPAPAARPAAPAAGAAQVTPGTAAAAAPEPVVPPAALEELPLKVVFDLGDVELTLAELKALVPGQAIALGRDPGNAVRVTVNGLKIGTGEIVEIDGRLGVRITELAAGHARSTS
jgi:type III secretion system YscQ/HrcQ family protein